MLHPTYTCRRIEREIALTGKLDDPLWQLAEAVELTDPVTGESKPLPAYARLLYSASHLYLGFQCMDDYVFATFTEHDAYVWQEGCMEAFICPSGNIRHYYEINLNPLNTVFDAFILNGFSEGNRQMIPFHNYTCEGLQTAVHVNGKLGKVGAQGWTAEYAIPYTRLIGSMHLTPEPGDEWRLNLCHISSAKPEETQTFYSWATIGRVDFHQSHQFGTLRFV